jgi:hypothetical protein
LTVECEFQTEERLSLFFCIRQFAGVNDIDRVGIVVVVDIYHLQVSPEGGLPDDQPFAISNNLRVRPTGVDQGGGTEQGRALSKCGLQVEGGNWPAIERFDGDASGAEACNGAIVSFFS